MVLLCQTFLVVTWCIGLLAGLIRGAQAKTENQRFTRTVIDLIANGVLLFCYIRTGALTGFLFF